LAQLLAWPALTGVGVAAFLLAFGDAAGGRGRQHRLLIASGVGACAVASGVLAGAHWLSAALGMAAWGVATALAGVYGAAAAAMALPVAWSYLEIGLSSPSHSLAQAGLHAALFAAGGLWATLLARLIGAVNTHGPLRRQIALCFQLLGRYLEGAGHGDPDPLAVAPLAPEAALRAAIARAQTLAAERRGRQAAMATEQERLVLLLALVDRGFALAAAHAELQGPGCGRLAPGPGDGTVWREPLAATARAVADALDHRPTPIASPNGDLPGLASELARLLGHALSIARGDAPPPIPAPPPPPLVAEESRRPPWLAPLLRCMDRRSVVGRHALRYGLVLAVAVAIEKACAPPFGYWIPLTASVVLRPYAGSTLQRAVERLLGTTAGIVVGMALMALAGSDATRALLTLAAFFGALALLPLHYGLAIAFLSVGLVPFEALLVGAAVPEIGALRLFSTLVGGALALAGGFLLWPSFERGSLPGLIASSVASMAGYATLVFALLRGAPASPKRLAAQRQRAGVDLSNAQAALQRVVGELGQQPADLLACVLAIATLQRMFVSLTAVREMAAAASACPGLAQQGIRSVATHPLLAYEIERITLQIATLQWACERLPAARGRRGCAQPASAIADSRLRL
jgi:uncharacterized membrane protein YccC